MSGKPATVAAPRAGVPSAPRVLVYVADPRQLEPAAAAPDPQPAPPQPPPPNALYLHENQQQLNHQRNTHYRTPNEHRHQSHAIFYKQANDADCKYGAYGSADNAVPRTDFYPLSQQYVKDPCMKIEDNKIERVNLNVKRDCIEQTNPEYCGVDTFHARLPVESVDVGVYQSGCTIPVGSDTSMPSMQSVGLRHGQNQFSESVTVHSGVDSTNCGDRELSVGKSYVNYQFLEQSVSHQSIVNQSISILNQQVGVSRGVISEGESGGAQLVRTADGVVLAVLPSPAPVCDSEATTPPNEPPSITVPLGWKRIVTGTSVLYISPSGSALSNQPQLRDYLQTAGTCKCGLPCPLRPETAFSFDSKVTSKPYQAASGAELTKLCNHKRKLLASLQARSQSPVTPPPSNEQKKVTNTETASKKKMKKRPGYPSNMGVSQLMVQRERPLNEFKPQEPDHSRVVSPGVAPPRANSGQPCLPSYTPVPQTNMQNVPLPNTSLQEGDVKQESHIQKSSHYLTVNSGWITQHVENLDSSQKQIQTSASASSNTVNVGTPVLGTNGQIIGVNTSFNKQTANYKNIMNVMPQNIVDQELNDEKKDILTQQNMQAVKYSYKEEESQIFCGLNQPLTPEVMQKINEQQQIFIQQNQKQIEMAMKGFRNQLVDNVNHIKPQNQNQYVPQGQLVIQNGAVVKTNPAKTPPWQVKKNDTNTCNPMSSPNPKLTKQENVEFDESNANISEDSSSSFSSFSSNEPVVNQNMCSRVPPLPQHYNMLGQQWPNLDSNKKKMKSLTNKGAKKKLSPCDNKIISFGNNGMRLVQDSKRNPCEDMVSNNVPSFMDDPSGYLAQQTVLLKNTISRQVGISSNYDSNQYENTNQPNSYMSQNQSDKNKLVSKPGDMSNAYRNHAPNQSLSPNNIPDSSVALDKSADLPVSQCCKGCNLSSLKSSSPEYTDNHMRMKYMKHMYKMDVDGSHASTSSPRHGFEDSPVTSSTFIDRSPLVSEQGAPIQAGTVSTSSTTLGDAPPPEPSPTLSASSRTTDTPHSNGNTHTYPMPSPTYSNSGSYRDTYNTNPLTPGTNQLYPYNSPGPPIPQSISGTQMMHFISNHNVNKNLMEVDNISMVGVKPALKAVQEMYRLEPRRRMENAMPGYCPPPHLGGGPAHSLIQACYVQTFVTTMASGFSVTRDTVTSVLAGKANTATTSINASHANFIRPPPPPSVNLATTYAIPNNQPDPFLNSVNLPTSYPLHIAGTTAQNMISKSPLEMVQNVIGNLPSKSENGQTSAHQPVNRRTCHTPGQILISSTGQIIVSNNHMPPPPPKTTTSVSPIQGPSTATSVSTSIHQASAVGGVQAVVNQPAVVVNTLGAPFVLPPMVVDGQALPPGAVLPHLLAPQVLPGHSPNDNNRQIDLKTQSFVQGVAMLSPETLKKRNKRKKNQSPNVLQIAASQQNPNNIMVHHSSPQHNSSPQFSPRSFQLSPNNNISPTPMLQALTIVPGKSGAPAHIVMNGQGNGNNFGSQQIITNTSPSQQINLLQPVNLINNTNSVMSNFPAFQQFIVPNLGGMVMTADGTAIIPDNTSGMSMQLQLQTVNGQNVLTPVQSSGVFATGANGGVVLRAQSQPGKMLQSQHSPGAQFLSPGSQVVVGSPGFGGQLSPLLAGLSPPAVFGAQPRPAPPDYLQPGPVGPALMVPLSPKPARASTFVQNTTIVQQQTTLVSNTHALGAKGAGKGRHVRHSVSTQTLAARGRSPGAAGASPPGASPPGASPPDTTTHSPGAEASSPRCQSSQAHYADTTTSSPEPPDASSSAMVQCVSSSEPDMAEAREHTWPTPRNDFTADNDAQNMVSNIPLIRQNPNHNNSVESTELQYNQNINNSANNQHVIPMTSNYYDRTQIYKRKNEFGDGATYRSDKIMRTKSYGMVHGVPKESDYDCMGIGSQDKAQSRPYPLSGSSSDQPTIPKVYNRHNLGSGDDALGPSEEGGAHAFAVGDVVWGGFGRALWPARVEALAARGGAVRVRWFGPPRPHAPSLLPARRLLTLCQGLEAHHAARSNLRKSRKLNTLLENAIQEAMAELDKKSSGAENVSESGEGGEEGVREETEGRADEAGPPRRARRHSRRLPALKHELPRRTTPR